MIQPYWNYRDNSYLSTDERHTARQSVEGGSQSGYDAGYTTAGLRSYTNEPYSTTGKCVRSEAKTNHQKSLLERSACDAIR